MNQPDTSDRLERVLVATDAPISVALAQLDRAGTGALVFQDGNGGLAGLLTDGDIRRAILRGVPFDAACAKVATREPIRVTPDLSRAECLRLMNSYDVNHLPVVTADGILRGLLLRSDLMTEDDCVASAVIMAGGFGKRLLPLTEATPKPMLPVGDTPLLERTIRRLSEAGIRQVSVTTHHLSDRITGYFGDGAGFGVDINYIAEDHPLGTVGSLKRFPSAGGPILVINGDVLTGVQFRNLVAYHREQGADITVGVRRYELEVPYGVVECEGPYLRRVEEKPRLHFLVNAGIYMLDRSVLRYIPADQRFDMTDLLGKLLEAGRPVVTFPVVEYWLDIGRPADYEQAQRDLTEGRLTA
ncbi:MAG TPA: nucleotidyltransferase family protein [Bryobacteraceae bacterium]|nr:nucleotidyltransferase family protein [Bryobacteraceae bacterium]